MANKKEKEALAHLLAEQLSPTFKGMGFRHAGKMTFTKKVDKNCMLRYVLSLRHPRYSDDPHSLYINPCVHVIYPELRKLYYKFLGTPFRPNFPTLGGSLGLYTPHGHSKDFPLDDEKSVFTLAPALIYDIENYAQIFWDKLSPVTSLLEAYEEDSWYARSSIPGNFYYLILVKVEKGLDAALQLLENEPQRFQGRPKAFVIKRITQLEC